MSEGARRARLRAKRDVAKSHRPSGPNSLAGGCLTHPGQLHHWLHDAVVQSPHPQVCDGPLAEHARGFLRDGRHSSCRETYEGDNGKGGSKQCVITPC